MDVKMRIDRDDFIVTDSVVVKLSGNRTMVDILRKVIINLSESNEWVVR